MLLLVLATEQLREAMDRTREGAGGALTTLKSAIATAEAAEGVDGAMLQEAKTLLATKPLETAMEQREVAGLRATIGVAEREVAVDRTVVEVSGWCGQRTRAIHAWWSRCNPLNVLTRCSTNSRL